MSKAIRVFCLCLILVSAMACGALARPYTIEFNTTTTGSIYTDLLSPAGTVMANSPASWGTPGSMEYRGFYDFDCSGMQVAGFPQITKVEFFYGAGLVAVSFPPPASFDAGLYIGGFMADGLSWADWNAGTFAADQSWAGSPRSTWIDLGADAINMFYEIGPDYIAFAPPENFSVAIRSIGNGDFIAGTRHCKLRVSYYPDFGKAMEENASFGSVKALYR